MPDENDLKAFEKDDEIADRLHDWSQTRTLYLILQGEFCLYTEKSPDHPVSDILHIVAPEIPGHQYKAGPWLTDWRNQLQLPPCELKLRHAFGDRKYGGEHSHRSTPEWNDDIITSPGMTTPDLSNARVHIATRMPLAILPGAMEHASDTVTIELFDSSGKVIGTKYVPPNPAQILILVYKWYSEARPYLWSPDTRDAWHPGGPSEDFLSLHAYASSPSIEEEDDPQHAREAFTAAAKILGEIASIDFGDAKFNALPAEPPAGLAWAQVNLTFAHVLELHQTNLLTLDDWMSPNCPPALLKTRAKAHGSGSSGNCGPQGGGH
jgi:hypothetical protein